MTIAAALACIVAAYPDGPPWNDLVDLELFDRLVWEWSDAIAEARQLERSNARAILLACLDA